MTNVFAYGYRRGFWFRSFDENDTTTNSGGANGGSYGSLTNFGLDKVHEGLLIQSTGITNRQGVSISNGRIIPFAPGKDKQEGSTPRSGIKFDSQSTGSLSVSNVSFFGQHERSLWMGPFCTARVTMVGGQSTEFTEQMVLNESSEAIVRLMGVRSFHPEGPRVQGRGSDQVEDANGILG